MYSICAMNMNTSHHHDTEDNVTDVYALLRNQESIGLVRLCKEGLYTMTTILQIIYCFNLSKEFHV